MKSKRNIVALLTLALLGHSAFAADWQHVTSAGKSGYNVDFDSVVSVNGYRKAWVKVNHFEEQKTNGYPVKSYRSQILLYYFDCKAKMIATTQSVLYSEINAGGDVVESRSNKFNAKDLDDVVPGSVGEALLSISCDTPAARAKIKAKNEADVREYLRSLQQDTNKNQNQNQAAGSGA